MIIDNDYLPEVVCKNLINSYDPDEESIKDEYEKLKKMISLAK